MLTIRSAKLRLFVKILIYSVILILVLSSFFTMKSKDVVIRTPILEFSYLNLSLPKYLPNECFCRTSDNRKIALCYTIPNTEPISNIMARSKTFQKETRKFQNLSIGLNFNCSFVKYLEKFGKLFFFCEISFAIQSYLVRV